jgi:hypothetical protein
MDLERVLKNVDGVYLTLILDHLRALCSTVETYRLGRNPSTYKTNDSTTEGHKDKYFIIVDTTLDM